MSQQTPSNRYRAIIFDMDGVIIDSKELVESFWIERFRQYNLPVPTEKFEERFHGRPGRLIIENEFPSLTEHQRSEMEREIKEYDSSATGFQLIPGVENFLQHCIDINLPIALVTSALPPKVNRMISSLSLTPPFETIVTADRVKNGKPNPECYRLAITEMNIKPTQTVVFEDSISGAQAALAAGATVIGVNAPHMIAPLQNTGATFVIENFDSIHIDNDPESATYWSFSSKNAQKIQFTVD